MALYAMLKSTLIGTPMRRILMTICLVATTGFFAATMAAESASAAGTTVWDGIYTDDQAEAGATQIADHCAKCHGNAMRGSPAGPSVISNLMPMFGDQPLSSLYDYITTQMPKGNPGSLSEGDYGVILARILQLAGVPSGKTELPLTSAELEPILLTSTAPPKQLTIWDGVFTEAQAEIGAQKIADSCAKCHSNSMRGSPAGPSVIANLMPMFGDQPLSSLYDYITTQMPKGYPGSLPESDYAAILARILQLNGAAPGEKELPEVSAELETIMLTAQK